MGDIVGFILLVVGLIFFVPVLVAWRLFARTRRLREDLEELRTRLKTLEMGIRRGPVETPAAVTHHEAGHLRLQADAPVAPVLPETPDTPRVQAEAAVTPGEDLPAEAGSHLPPVETLESRIGGRWLLNISIAAIVIGVAYFEKWAIDRQWIGETARVIQGGVFGLVLIYAGSRFAKRGLGLYGQMLMAGGVAILYVSTYAAFLFYHLIDRSPAYALMVGVTVLGAFLADRYKSQGLAVFAIGGGFCTPFLLQGTGDAQAALFTYTAMLIGGTVVLARRHAWPVLNVISYVFTLLIVSVWADRYYAPEKYLRTEIWITLFCAAFVSIGVSSRRLQSTFAEFAAWFVWTAPIAYYVASLNILGPHPVPKLVWFIAVALLGGILSVRAGIRWGASVWLAATLPFLVWTQESGHTALVIEGLVTAGALYAIALVGQLRRAVEHEPLTNVEIAWIHVAPLLSFAGAYLILEDVRVAATGPAAAVSAVWYVGLSRAFWVRERDRAVHFSALAFTLLALAIGLQFDGPAVTVGWAAEGAAIVALGLFERRGWLRIAGLALFLVAIVQTLDLLLSTAPATHVVVLNPRAATAMLVIALCYAIAWLHRRDPEAPSRRADIGAALIAAQVVSLVLLTSEIHAFFAMREAGFTRELLVSVTWAMYATALIVIGLQRRYAPIRYFAIGLFGITIAKVFFSDLAELDGIYRILSLIGLGVMLLVTSYLYQRMQRGTGLGNDAVK